MSRPTRTKLSAAAALAAATGFKLGREPDGIKAGCPIRDFG
jgi:hypothetical protein